MYYLFCSYIRVCFQLVACCFRLRICLTQGFVNGVLIRVCSLIGFLLFMGFYGILSSLFLRVNLELKNNDKIKEIPDTIKIIKSQRQPKNYKRIITSFTFGEITTQGVTKCNNKRCKICDIIIEGKSSPFKDPKTKFKINKDFSCNSKNVVYIIECSKCKEIYIGSTQALNTRISLHRNNIKITENRKLSVSKHLYECSHGELKIMSIYQTNDYTLLQIKEKKFIDKFKPNLNKTRIIHTHTHTHTHTNGQKIHRYIYIYIYTRTKIISKNDYQYIPNHITTHTHRHTHTDTHTHRHTHT